MYHHFSYSLFAFFLFLIHQVPVDGPPTMDLFKAIFQDSDSESEDEDKSEAERESDVEMSEVKTETTQRPFQSSSVSSKEVKSNVNNPVMRSVTELVSSIRDEVNTNASKEEERVKDTKKKVRVSRFEPKEGDIKKDDDAPPKHIFVPRKKVTESTEVQPAKGIFANIDFEALNSYRKLDPDPSKAQTDSLSDVGDAKEPTPKDSDSSVDSEDEYGPPIPTHLKNRNQMIRSTPASVSFPTEMVTKSTSKDSPWIVKEVKSKTSKKHKHKDKHKHKKEKKKKKKQKDKKKKHRRSRSKSSTDSSTDSE